MNGYHKVPCLYLLNIHIYISQSVLNLLRNECIFMYEYYLYRKNFAEVQGHRVVTQGCDNQLVLNHHGQRV